jgi:pyruvate kinase
MNAPARRLRKTKVIATIGPACDSPQVLKEMLQAGMNVARLNVSHGTREEHRERVEMVRRVSSETGASVAVMVDTRGVEIRTGRVEHGSVVLDQGESFSLYTDGRMGNAAGVSISYPGMLDEVRPGSPILIDDGKLQLDVVGVVEGVIRCRVVCGGTLRDRKGVNLPHVRLRRAGSLPDDVDDLLFAADNDVEYVAASFVQCADDVRAIRRVLDERGSDIHVIAKIENQSGVDNLEEIIAEANGTMVARGDLGVELPLEQVPAVQKKIIRTTVLNGKPVITATQMLDSMERNPRPTRAEVSDVANAILDGTSAVMLSGETAVGAYPVEAVRTMASLALQAQGWLREYGYLQKVQPHPANVVTEAVAQASITMAHHLNAAAIISLTETGFTSRQISKHRPDCPILAVTTNLRVVRKLAMNWGVLPLLYEGEPSDDARIRFAVRRALESGYAHPGEVAVVTVGQHQQTGGTNAIRVVEIQP